MIITFMKRRRFDKYMAAAALRIAVPAIVESFFVAFAGLVDSFYGKLTGGQMPEFAAVGLTTQPKFLGLSVFMAMNVSLSALVARRFGANKRSDAKRDTVNCACDDCYFGSCFGRVSGDFCAPNNGFVLAQLPRPTTALCSTTGLSWAA